MQKVLFVSCFEDWYRLRLKPIITLFDNTEYSVECVLSDYDHIRKQYSRKYEDECTYIHVPAYKKNISPNRIISHLSFGKQIKKLIKKNKPDVIYLVLPPNNTAKYCSQYKKKNPDVKLFLDIIDLWPESLPLRSLQSMPPIRIWKSWRNDSIIHSDYVFTECDLYQEILKGVIDKEKSSTLHLFKEQSKEEKELVKKAIHDRALNEPGVLKLAYLGSMNNIIDIDGICGVIKQLISAGYRCELHAVGDGECKASFEEEVSSTGCGVFFYGSIFNEIEKIKLLAQCDYALNMMKNEVSVGLTMKSIDYLSYGLPLINNIKGDTWNMINKYGIGMNVDNKIDIERHFDGNDILDFYIKHFSKEAFLKKASVLNEVL